MDLDQYYKTALKLGTEVKNQDSSILRALNSGSVNDHPSEWVPKIQKVLLVHYKKYSNTDCSDQILDLYVQGEILEDKAERNLVVKTGFICLVLGVSVGWFLWG